MSASFADKKSCHLMLISFSTSLNVCIVCRQASCRLKLTFFFNQVQHLHCLQMRSLVSNLFFDQFIIDGYLLEPACHVRESQPVRGTPTCMSRCWFESPSQSAALWTCISSSRLAAICWIRHAMFESPSQFSALRQAGRIACSGVPVSPRHSRQVFHPSCHPVQVRIQGYSLEAICHVRESQPVLGTPTGRFCCLFDANGSHAGHRLL